MDASAACMDAGDMCFPGVRVCFPVHQLPTSHIVIYVS